MALYCIADLHLSLGTNKSMEIFDGWQNYIEKLDENWRRTITQDDTVVIAGDFSWGISLEEALLDFVFVENLPGTKILLKGNHDYWWSTKTKIEKFFLSNNLNSFRILHNNSFEVDKMFVCGTRGWMFENGESNCVKLIDREANRLELSIKSCTDLSMPIIAFLHYPPIYGSQHADKIINVLTKYGVSRCYYGHLHGNSVHYSINGICDKIHYRLISSDYTGFKPVKVSL